MGFLGEKKNSGVRSPKAELGLAYLRAEDLLSRMKLWAREKGRLRDHWQDWPGD